MKRLAFNFAVAALLASLSFPAFAQDEKDKEKKKDVEQIIITSKGDNKKKIVVEIDGDKVTINGKPAEDFKDEDIKVLRNKFKSFDGLNAYNIPRTGGQAWNFNWDNNDAMSLYGNADSKRAMLGVVTEKVDGGVKVNEVTKESAAEKAGLKDGDIITKINDKGIENPDELSETIHKQKPGDKVTITYLRDKKEQKVTAELGKWKGAGAFAFGPGMNFEMKMPEMNLRELEMPRGQSIPRVAPFGQTWNWAGGSPRLGLSVQDTEDGKGVKVIDADDEGNGAKAGIKEDDIITHFNDKEVNSADELAKLVKENKDKSSFQLKIKRDGKTQNIEVKMPKKLKTADL